MTQTLESLRAALEERLRFETIVADLSAEFVNLESDLIDGAIQDAQRRIVEALDLDRSSLFQFSDDATTMVFTHYWSRPGFAPLEMSANPVEHRDRAAAGPRRECAPAGPAGRRKRLPAE